MGWEICCVHSRGRSTVNSEPRTVYRKEPQKDYTAPKDNGYKWKNFLRDKKSEQLTIVDSKLVVYFKA